MSPTYDIDVLASCYDPDTPPTMVLESVTNGAHTTASIVGGKVRVAPQPGWFGTDELPYTISKGGGAKRSSSKIILSVARATTPTPTPTPGVPEEPSYSHTFTVGFSQDGATEYASAAAAHAAASPGTRILLNPSPNSYGALTLSIPGVFWDVRGGQWGGATLVLRISGADIWVRGMRIGAGQVVITGDRVRLWRRTAKGWSNTSGNGQVQIQGKNCFVCYGELSDSTAAGIVAQPANGARYATIGRNYIHDFSGPGNGHEAIRSGESNSTRLVNAYSLVCENYLENIGPRLTKDASGQSENETIGFKSSKNTARGNTMVRCRDYSNRHGGNGNDWLSNYMESSGSFRIKDKGGLLSGNVCATGGIILDAGNVTGATYTGGSFPQCDGWTLRGNQAPLDCDYDFGDQAKFKYPSISTAIEGHSGTIRNGRSSPMVRGALGPTAPLARKLAVTEVGPNAPWVGWPML